MNADTRIQSIGPPQRELLIAMYRGFDPPGAGLANFATEGLKEDFFVSTSVTDLGKKQRKYIRAYSKSAKPFRWAHTDPT